MNSLHSNKPRQHTVQAKILGEFSNDSIEDYRKRKLNAYNKEAEKNHPISVNNATVVNKFLPDSVDKSINGIEGNTLNRILNLLEGRKYDAIDEYFPIYQYSAFQLIRNQKFRNIFDKTGSSYQQLFKRDIIKPEYNHEPKASDLYYNLITGDFNTDFPKDSKQWTSKFIIALDYSDRKYRDQNKIAPLDIISGEIMNKYFPVIHENETEISFLMNENPVLFLENDLGIDVTTKIDGHVIDVGLLFPLSPKRVIIFGKTEQVNEWRQATRHIFAYTSEKTVKNFNQWIFNNSNRFVFYKNKRDIDYILKN